MLLCAAVILVEAVSLPVGVRSPVVLLFAMWVPGMSILWLLDGSRPARSPGLPAVAISLSVLVLASGIPLEFGIFPSRAGFVVLASASWLVASLTLLTAPSRQGSPR